MNIFQTALSAPPPEDFTLAEVLNPADRFCKPAFTLSEVLMTLGIIGVVSAITMPTLIANHQKKVLKNQYKKAYANIYNIINFVNNNNGIIDCYNLKTSPVEPFQPNRVSECRIFWKEVRNNIKISNSCDYSNGKCKVKYKTQDEVLAAGGNTHVITCGFLNYKSNIYTLNDGSYLILHDNENESDINLQYFAIDTNGEKGPNKWGYDLFYYTMIRQTLDSKLELSDSYCSMKEKGGYSPTDMLVKD